MDQQPKKPNTEPQTSSCWSNQPPKRRAPDGDHIKLDRTNYKIPRKPSDTLKQLIAKDGQFKGYEPTIYEKIGKWLGLTFAITFWLIALIIWRCFK